MTRQFRSDDGAEKRVAYTRDFYRVNGPRGIIRTTSGVHIEVQWDIGEAEAALAAFDRYAALVRSQILDADYPGQDADA